MPEDICDISVRRSMNFREFRILVQKYVPDWPATEYVLHRGCGCVRVVHFGFFFFASLDIWTDGVFLLGLCFLRSTRRSCCTL